MDDPLTASERVARWMSGTSHELPLVLVEMVAWTLAKAARPLPAPRDIVSALAAHIAAAVATGDEDAFEAVVSQAVASDHETGYAALMTAEVLGGTRWPHRVAEYLAGFDEPMPNRTVVHTLASTDTERALRLIDGFGETWLSPAAVESLADLVIVTRNSGKIQDEVERRWRSLEGNDRIADANLAWLDMHIRVTAHENLRDAVAELTEVAGWYGWRDLYEGALAVLARLVRTDPEWATELAGAGDTWTDQADLLQALAWWGEFPDPALPLLDALLQAIGPEDEGLLGSVIYTLARSADHARLEQLLRRCRPANDVIVRGVAPALRRLRMDGSQAVRSVFEVASRALRLAAGPEEPSPVDCLCIQGGFDLQGPWWVPYGSQLP